MFTHLHWHSTFSFLEAIGQPADIVSKAKSLGMQGIAITDLGGMYSAIKLYQSAKAQEMTPILGVELGFVVDIADFRPHHEIGNICLLALNYEGYLNLIKLVSIANTEGIDGRAKIDLKHLEQYSSNIVAFFGGEESWLGKKILKNTDKKQTEEILQKLVTIFGKENVFLEIIAQEHSKLPDVEKINHAVHDLAKKHELGVIVGNTYRYINQEDKESWEIALAIKDVKKIYDEDRRKPVGDFSIQSEEEIVATCQANGFVDAEIQQRIATNNSILERVNIEIDMYQSLFPVHQTPENIQDIYEKVKDELVVKK